MGQSGVKTCTASRAQAGKSAPQKGARPAARSSDDPNSMLICGVGPSCRERSLCEGAEKRALRNAYEAFEFNVSPLLGPSLSDKQKVLVQSIVDGQCEILTKGQNFNVNGRQQRVTLDADEMTFEIVGEGSYPLHKIQYVQLSASWSTYDVTLMFEKLMPMQPKGNVGEVLYTHPPLKFSFDDLNARLHFALTCKVLRTLAPQLRADRMVAAAAREEQKKVRAASKERRKRSSSVEGPQGIPGCEETPSSNTLSCERCGDAGAVYSAKPCGCKICENCAEALHLLPVARCLTHSVEITELDELPGVKIQPRPFRPNLQAPSPDDFIRGSDNKAPKRGSKRPEAAPDYFLRKTLEKQDQEKMEAEKKQKEEFDRQWRSGTQPVYMSRTPTSGDQPSGKTESSSAAERISAMRKMRSEGRGEQAATGTSAPCSSNAPASDDADCVICLENPGEMAFIPCGHRCICQTCARDLPPEARRNCPQCRQPATDLLRIYT